MDELIAPAAGRLDVVLTEALGMPRADVQRAIKAGRVRVNKVPRAKSFMLEGGERLLLDMDAAGDLLPEPGPRIPFLYDDDHLTVIDKPANLVTHPTKNRRDGTLVNRLLGMGVPLAPGDDPLRPGIVHRLDVGTSGAMVIAKDDETYHALRARFRVHDVDRQYLALVRGTTEHDRFVVEAPLERSRALIVVRPVTGRPSETAFEVLERFENAILLQAAPRTGRTHQIRVHAAAVGLPILGDKRYGGWGEDAKRLGLTRPFLHSWKIGFDHPVTGERITCEAPLPSDLQQALDVMRTPSPAEAPFVLEEPDDLSDPGSR